MKATPVTREVRKIAGEFLWPDTDGSTHLGVQASRCDGAPPPVMHRTFEGARSKNNVDSKQRGIQDSPGYGPWVVEQVEIVPGSGGPWGQVINTACTQVERRMEHSEHLPRDSGPWGADDDGGPWCHHGDEEHRQQCGPQDAVEPLGPWAAVEDRDDQEVGGPKKKRLKTASAYASTNAAKIAGPRGAQLDEPDEFSDEPDEFDRQIVKERAGIVRERSWSAR